MKLANATRLHSDNALTLAQAHRTVTVAARENEQQIAKLAATQDAYFSSIGTKAGGALVGIIGLSTGVVAALAGIGEQFENINRGITLATDVTSQALSDMKNAADSLVGSMDVSTKSVGTDMAVLAGRLQTTGDGVKQLTLHVEELRGRFGSLDVQALSGAFVEFGVSAGKADSVLASLLASAQHFQTPLPDIVKNVGQFADVFTAANLSMEQSGHLIGELTQKGIPLNQAIMGLEVAEKAAAKAGEDLPTFIDRAARSMEYYRSIGNETAADQIALDIFGQRRWVQGEKAAQSYLDTLRSGKDAFKGDPANLDKTIKDTQTLKDKFTELRNQIESALAPVAANVVDDLSHKFESFQKWLEAHKQDLKTFFETAAGAAMHIITLLGDMAAWLGRHPALIGAIVAAFAAWKTITVISEMITGLKVISTLLSATLPAAATKAAAANVAAAETSTAAWAATGTAVGGVIAGLIKLVPYAAAATAAIAATNAATGDRTNVDPRKNPEGWWGTGSGILGGTMRHLFGQDNQQSPPGASTHTAPPGSTGSFYGGWYGTPDNAPPTQPGPPPPAAPTAPGVPPPDLLTPGTAGTTGGGEKEKPKAPEAPEVPYGPGFNAPPPFGETAEHYSARGNILEAQHKVEEDRARLNQLENDNNTTQDQIQKARNKLVEDQRAEQEARMRLSEQEQRSITDHTQKMRRTGDALQQVGAQIDQDFGISKGLPGIAENLTKFLANLAFAPVLGALGGVVAAGGGVPKGAGGLIGAAAVGGAFGPQYTGAAGGGGDAGLATQSSYPGSVGSPAELQAAGSRVGALYSLASSLEGTPYSKPLRDDCSGIVSELSSAALGLPIPSAGQRFNTTNEGDWLMSHGFQSGSPPPGANAFSVGWNPAPGDAGHTAATLPGGIHAEQGGSNSSFTLGPKAAGAESPQFPLHAWLPMGGGGTPGGNFDALAARESSGNWGTDTGNGYYGGLQFDQPTWDTYRGPGTPYNAAAASKEQQIQAAKSAIQARGGPQSLWPQNYGQLNTPSFDSGGAVSAVLHEGEHVLTKSDVSAMGGQSGVYAMRNALHYDNGGEVSPFTPPGIPAGAPVSKPSGLGDLLGVGGGSKPKPASGLPGDVPTHGQGGLTNHSQGTAGQPQVGPFPVPPKVAAQIPKLQGRPEQKPGEGPRSPGGPPIAEPKLPGDIGPPAPPAPPEAPEHGPTMVGGAAPPQGYGKGFEITGGGLIGLAEQAPGMAASAAGGMFPGGGAAGSAAAAIANIGIQEANRAIGAAGQAVGALGSGVLQTILPAGGSDLANQNWLTRFAGGIIGAKPQLPNVAGPKQGAGGLTPEQAAESGGGMQHGAGGAPGPGGPSQGAGAPLVHIEGGYHNHGTEGSGWRSIEQQAIAMNASVGSR